MYYNELTTKDLIDNSYSLKETLQSLRQRGICLSAATLNLYMANSQNFPRFISMYNPKLAKRERRWLKGDVHAWVPAKVRRQREQVIFLERKVEALKLQLKRETETTQLKNRKSRKTGGWGIG